MSAAPAMASRIPRHFHTTGYPTLRIALAGCSASLTTVKQKHLPQCLCKYLASVLLMFPAMLPTFLAHMVATFFAPVLGKAHDFLAQMVLPKLHPFLAQMLATVLAQMVL